MALPQFTPRQFEEILQDMINIIRLVAPELTDFNVGSRIRTILEVCSLEDDEQYDQMANLLLLWNLRNLRGRDLDERLAEWNIARRGALFAGGEVIVSNANVTTSFLATAKSIGATLQDLLSTAGFPTTGFPYGVRIDEGLASTEDVLISANSISTNTLTSAALTKDHNQFARVTLIEGGPLVVPAGTRVRVPATDDFPERTATLTQAATVLAGNIDSNAAAVVMDVPGELGNVSEGAIKRFVGTAPFDGALVRNDARFSGGRDVESDEQFLSSGLTKIQSLARATPLSLEELVIGEEFTGTDGRTFRVIAAKVSEEFGDPQCEDRVFLYIWPGSFDFVTTADVNVIEVLTVAAEDGQKFFRLANTAIVPGSLVLQRKIAGTATFVTLTQGVDYFFNEGTGWIQMQNPGLNLGDALQALRYTHYTGLIQRVQTVVNGSPVDPLNFPGIAAAGIKVYVSFPRPRPAPQVRLAIQVRSGFVESVVAAEVRNVLTNYLQSLKVGEDIILNELVERAMGVDGMFDVQFSSPTSNFVVLEDEALDLENLVIVTS